jgi:hypothetical protein
VLLLVSALLAFGVVFAVLAVAGLVPWWTACIGPVVAAWFAWGTVYEVTVSPKGEIAFKTLLRTTWTAVAAILAINEPGDMAERDRRGFCFRFHDGVVRTGPDIGRPLAYELIKRNRWIDYSG